MIEYRYDDGGRKAAGFKGDTGDCVTRAIAIITGKSYQDVYDMMSTAMRSHGYPATANMYRINAKRGGRKRPISKVIEDVLMESGLTKVKLPKGPKPSYSEAFERYGDCIVRTTKHMAAIVDGELRDTFDGRTYEWQQAYSHHDNVNGIVPVGKPGGTYERKAMSVWIKT